MSAFTIVPCSMYSHDFTLLSPNAQRLEWCIRTCPSRTSEGLFRFTFGMVEDLIGMSRSDAAEAMRELVSRRPFFYDFDAGVLFDRLALREQPLKRGDHRMTHAVRMLKGLPSTPLKKALVVAAHSYAPDFYDRIIEEFPELGPGHLDPEGVQAPPSPSKGVQGTRSEEQSSEEGSRDAVALLRDQWDVIEGGGAAS